MFFRSVLLSSSVSSLCLLPLRQKPYLNSFRCKLKVFLSPKPLTYHVFRSVLLSSSISSLSLLSVLSSVNQYARNVLIYQAEALPFSSNLLIY